MPREVEQIPWKVELQSLNVESIGKKVEPLKEISRSSSKSRTFAAKCGTDHDESRTSKEKSRKFRQESRTPERY